MRMHIRGLRQVLRLGQRPRPPSSPRSAPRTQPPPGFWSRPPPRAAPWSRLKCSSIALRSASLLSTRSSSPGRPGARRSAEPREVRRPPARAGAASGGPAEGGPGSGHRGAAGRARGRRARSAGPGVPPRHSPSRRHRPPACAHAQERRALRRAHAQPAAAAGDALGVTAPCRPVAGWRGRGAGGGARALAPRAAERAGVGAPSAGCVETIVWSSSPPRCGDFGHPCPALGPCAGPPACTQPHQ